MKKFQDPNITLDGTPRAKVSFKGLKTLWFNTGTRCNLTCKNCYIESSPTNDRLVYIDKGDILPYLEEILKSHLPTREIAFTGGEPFINPHFLDILEETLSRGFDVLVLTNAYRALERHKARLLNLNERFAHKLFLRISLDHYTPQIHERERGRGTFLPTLENIKWLKRHNFNVGLAGRSLSDESQDKIRQGYMALAKTLGLEMLVIFPEMDEKIDVPEITEKCWSILGKDPDEMMCATSRMVVKRKGAKRAVVLPCTLLPYGLQFELGHTLEEAKKTVPLNHPHCAKFCVLGGASCSGHS